MNRCCEVPNRPLLARFLAEPGRRDQVTLATKFAIRQNPDAPGGREVRGDAPYVRQAVDAVGAMAGLVEAGKVRYLACPK